MKGIIITDDRDSMDQLDIKIDSGDFSNLVPGIYTIRYTVTDRDGNVLTFTRKIKVLETLGESIIDKTENIVDTTYPTNNNINVDNITNIVSSENNTSNGNNVNVENLHSNTLKNNNIDKEVSEYSISNNNNDRVNSDDNSISDTKIGNKILEKLKAVVKNPFSWLFLLLLLLLLLLFKRNKEEEQEIDDNNN